MEGSVMRGFRKGHGKGKGRGGGREHSRRGLQRRRTGLKHEVVEINLGMLQESMENHKELLRREVAESDLHFRKSSGTTVH